MLAPLTVAIVLLANPVEHISNGGLQNHNPGLDSIGLSFVILMGGHAGLWHRATFRIADRCTGDSIE